MGRYYQFATHPLPLHVACDTVGDVKLLLYGKSQGLGSTGGQKPGDGTMSLPCQQLGALSPASSKSSASNLTPPQHSPAHSALC